MSINVNSLQAGSSRKDYYFESYRYVLWNVLFIWKEKKEGNIIYNMNEVEGNTHNRKGWYESSFANQLNPLEK